MITSLAFVNWNKNINARKIIKDNKKLFPEINQNKSDEKLPSILLLIFHNQVGLLNKNKSSFKENACIFQDAILKPSKGLKKDIIKL